MKNTTLIAICLLAILTLMAGCNRHRSRQFTAGHGCSTYNNHVCHLWVQDLDNPHKAHSAIVLKANDELTLGTHSTDPGEQFVAHFVQIQADCTQPVDTAPIACGVLPAGGKHLLNPDPPANPGFQVPPAGSHNHVLDTATDACFKTVIQKKNGQCVDPHIYVCNAC